MTHTVTLLRGPRKPAVWESTTHSAAVARASALALLHDAEWREDERGAITVYADHYYARLPQGVEP